MRYLGCLWVTARRTSRQRERVLSLGKMFGKSVGWFGGWAKSYVQVEYANRTNLVNNMKVYMIGANGHEKMQ